MTNEAIINMANRISFTQMLHQTNSLDEGGTEIILKPVPQVQTILYGKYPGSTHLRWDYSSQRVNTNACAVQVQHTTVATGQHGILEFS